MPKELFAILGVVMTFVLYIPYIRAIRRGETKPHVFSWVIWGFVTIVVFFAQLAGGGGFGAWVIGVSGLVSSYIAWLAYTKRGDTAITRSDWLFLGGATCALPFWFFTSNPLSAVIILTTVDVLGFGPTVRKAYSHPHEESLALFALFTVRNALVILAVEKYSYTTLLFPAAVGLSCFFVVLLLLHRRRLVPATPTHTTS